eukprot:scaffold15925_cov54-Phaeocystis_antarctica.AAC.1
MRSRRGGLAGERRCRSTRMSSKVYLASLLSLHLALQQRLEVPPSGGCTGGGDNPDATVPLDAAEARTAHARPAAQAAVRQRVVELPSCAARLGTAGACAGLRCVRRGVANQTDARPELLSPRARGGRRGGRRRRRRGG